MKGDKRDTRTTRRTRLDNPVFLDNPPGQPQDNPVFLATTPSTTLDNPGCRTTTPLSGPDLEVFLATTWYSSGCPGGLTQDTPLVGPCPEVVLGCLRGGGGGHLRANAPARVVVRLGRVPAPRLDPLGLPGHVAGHQDAVVGDHVPDCSAGRPAGRFHGDPAEGSVRHQEDAAGRHRDGGGLGRGAGNVVVVDACGEGAALVSPPVSLGPPDGPGRRTGWYRRTA